MKTNMKYKLILLVLLPFIIGFLIEGLFRLGITSLGSLLFIPWIYGGGLIFWFWVGRTFGKLNLQPIKSFILGNLAWGISFGLYTWRVVFLNDISGSHFLTGLSEFYALGFVGLGTRILRLFTNQIHGTTAMQIAYFLMLIVFSLGFFSALHLKSAQSEGLDESTG